MRVSFKTTVVAAGLLLFCYFANFIYAILSKQSGGTFGDSFGAVNALFSGSALFFLVLAFISQREELQLVKEERDDTRQLLKGQEEITRQQKAAIEQQVFEQSFYSLISTLAEEIRSLDAPQGERAIPSLTIAMATANTISGRFEAGQITLRNFKAIGGDALLDCTQFCKLTVTIYDFIGRAKGETSERFIFEDILKSLFDARTIVLFMLFSVANYDDNAKYAFVFNKLGLPDLLPEEKWHKIFEEVSHNLPEN